MKVKNKDNNPQNVEATNVATDSSENKSESKVIEEIHYLLNEIKKQKDKLRKQGIL